MRIDSFGQSAEARLRYRNNSTCIENSTCVVLTCSVSGRLDRRGGNAILRFATGLQAATDDVAVYRRDRLRPTLLHLPTKWRHICAASRITCREPRPRWGGDRRQPVSCAMIGGVHPPTAYRQLVSKRCSQSPVPYKCLDYIRDTPPTGHAQQNICRALIQTLGFHQRTFGTRCCQPYLGQFTAHLTYHRKARNRDYDRLSGGAPSDQPLRQTTRRAGHGAWRQGAFNEMSVMSRVDLSTSISTMSGKWAAMLRDCWNCCVRVAPAKHPASASTTMAPPSTTTMVGLWSWDCGWAWCVLVRWSFETHETRKSMRGTGL